MLIQMESTINRNRSKRNRHRLSKRRVEMVAEITWCKLPAERLNLADIIYHESREKRQRNRFKSQKNSKPGEMSLPRQRFLFGLAYYTFKDADISPDGTLFENVFKNPNPFSAKKNTFSRFFCRFLGYLDDKGRTIRLHEYYTAQNRFSFAMNTSLILFNICVSDQPILSNNTRRIRKVWSVSS